VRASPDSIDHRHSGADPAPRRSPLRTLLYRLL
jgi:hypothetical protein